MRAIARNDVFRLAGQSRGHLQRVFKIIHRQAKRSSHLGRATSENGDEMQNVGEKTSRGPVGALAAQEVIKIRDRMPGDESRGRPCLAPIRDGATLIVKRGAIEGDVQKHVGVDEDFQSFVPRYFRRR